MTLSSVVAAPSQFYLWQGHRIAYTVQGQGEPLLLIHGFGACWQHWRKNIPVLAAAGYRVYALDLLGFGASDKPLLDYGLELWQAQIEAFWQSHIQRPMVMVGNSIGGLLTLLTLRTSPQQVRAGVLLNCAGGLNHRPDELHFPLNWVMGAFTRLVTGETWGPWLFNQIRQKKRIRNTLYQIYGDRQAVTDELVEMLYQPSCHENAQKVFASILAAPAGPAPAQLLPHIETPLLVIWGEKDPWTPLSGAKIYQQRAQSRGDTEFYTLPQAGHCPQDDAPQAVNELLLGWLGRLA